jgi:hypothetical protein
VAITTMELIELARNAETGDVDFLREGVRILAQAMMDAEVTDQVGAGHGERAPDTRTAQRNGYRDRRWDTRVGTVDLAIPKLRTGSYYPTFLQARTRAERALCSVVAQCYVEGVSTRRVEDIAAQMGIEAISKSQVSRICGQLDELVDAWRNRPLDAGPYTFIWIDALAMKVREDHRVQGVCVLVATGVNADGHREILGMDIGSAEDGATWTAPRGSGVEPISCATCSRRCRGTRSRWSRRWCAPSSRRNAPRTPGANSVRSSPSSRTQSWARRRSCWPTPPVTCSPTRASPKMCGARSGATTPCATRRDLIVWR